MIRTVTIRRLTAALAGACALACSAASRAEDGVIKRPGDHPDYGVELEPHLAFSLFNQMAGTQIEHVPYTSGGQALTDVIAGHVDITFTAVTARYVRMLGVTRGTIWGYSLYEFEIYNTGGGGSALQAGRAGREPAVTTRQSWKWS